MNTSSHKISIRPTVLADLEFVRAAEQHPDNAPYIGQWTQARHERAMAKPSKGIAKPSKGIAPPSQDITSQDEAHFIATLQSQPAQPVGYLILAGLSEPHRAVSLRRIVVVEKNKGYGRQMLQWVKQFTFETLGYHRLWFDVLEGNSRARHLYESEGFVAEGTVREGWRTHDTYQSMVMMSMLETEYARSSNNSRIIKNQEND